MYYHISVNCYTRLATRGALYFRSSGISERLRCSERATAFPSNLLDRVQKASGGPSHFVINDRISMKPARLPSADFRRIWPRWRHCRARSPGYLISPLRLVVWQICCHMAAILVNIKPTPLPSHEEPGLKSEMHWRRYDWDVNMFGDWRRHSWPSKRYKVPSRNTTDYIWFMRHWWNTLCFSKFSRNQGKSNLNSDNHIHMWLYFNVTLLEFRGNQARKKLQRDIFSIPYALTRAGPLLPGGVWAPTLTRLLGHAATHGKRHSKERNKIVTKLVQSILRSGQRSGYQRSPKVKFCRFQHFFFYKVAHNSGTRRATALQKSAFDIF